MQLRQNGDYSIVLLFIGFFILSGAAGEIRSAPVRAAIEGVITRDIMAANPPTSYEWMTVDAFLRTLPAGTTHRAYPVQAPDGRITGLLTADSILAVPRDQWASLRVSELAFPIDRVAVALVDEPVLGALQRNQAGATPYLLVVGPDGFAIASNSKAFTAASLAILVDEKKMSWDDKVTKYLPDFQIYDPWVTNELTIRDIVSHRVGLDTFSGDLLWYTTTYYDRRHAAAGAISEAGLELSHALRLSEPDVHRRRTKLSKRSRESQWARLCQGTNSDAAGHEPDRRPASTDSKRQLRDAAQRIGRKAPRPATAGTSTAPRLPLD